MPKESEMELLQRLRAEKEQESVSHREKTQQYLEAGFIAINAVLNAAAGGNVTCQAAAIEIHKILPELNRVYLNEKNATPKEDPAEKENAFWNKVRQEHIPTGDFGGPIKGHSEKQ